MSDDGDGLLSPSLEEAVTGMITGTQVVLSADDNLSLSGTYALASGPEIAFTGEVNSQSISGQLYMP